MKKMMILLFIAVFLAAVPAVAEKPNREGKGKLSAEQRQLHKSATQAKETAEGDVDEVKNEIEGKTEKTEKAKVEKGKALKDQQDEKVQGLEKQRARKSEQVQKELEKGSEQGQEARQQRRKWWRFWE